MYHQLQLSLHSDHPLHPEEMTSICAFLQIPTRALRNQLWEQHWPPQVHMRTTFASRITLPLPSQSHQTGLYALGPAFRPDVRSRPLETGPNLRVLHRRLAESLTGDGKLSSAPPRLGSLQLEALEGILMMMADSRQALDSRGYTAHFEALRIEVLPSATVVVYTLDHIAPHQHRCRLAASGADIPIQHLTQAA